ncbi:wall-associated receptor kinase-like protein 2 [Tanacetum coccineum]
MTKAKDQRSQSMKEQAYNVDRDKDHKSSMTKAISLISRRSVTMNSLRGRLVNVDKKEALENMDLILLCLDEIVDDGDIKPGNILFDESYKAMESDPGLLSDFYAFVVVLTELLTRSRHVASIDSDEGLILRFQHLKKHNRIFEILDTHAVEEAWMNDVVPQVYKGKSV